LSHARLEAAIAASDALTLDPLDEHRKRQAEPHSLRAHRYHELLKYLNAVPDNNFALLSKGLSLHSIL
jgi:hypothetical protein